MTLTYGPLLAGAVGLLVVLAATLVIIYYAAKRALKGE